MSRLTTFAAALAVIAMGASLSVLAADPDALKKIVRDRCMPQLDEGKPPIPCVEVDIDRGVENGYAILKDINGATQFLLITTDLITGIEDARVLKPDGPNYFADAWRARRFVEGKAGKTLPRESISLAVNSAYGRSQNQLHIHIDCIRREVRDLLTANETRIGPAFAPLSIDAKPYQVMRLEGEVLEADPFKLVAGQGPEIASSMGRETIIVVGARFRDGSAGFYVLSDRADPASFNQASGEILQDHACLLKDE